MNYHLYRAPEIQEVWSFPITLIDGTSSMSREYKYIIQSYEQIFGDLLETQRMQYQWSTNLMQIMPFANQERGNLSQALAQFFQWMLSIQFATQYVTIILVTDGREPFNINDIKQICELMKEKFAIQIFFIALGDQFPKTLIKSLKEAIEIQDFKKQYLFEIQRSDYLSYVQIQKELNQAFSLCKQNLIVTPKYHLLNFQVFYSITQLKSKNQLEPNELFLADKDQEIIIGNQKLQSINCPTTILQFLKSQLQYLYFQINLLNRGEIIQQLQEIFNFFDQMLINIESKEEQVQQLEMINLILKIIQQIIYTHHYEDIALSQQYIEQFGKLIYYEEFQYYKEFIENQKNCKSEGYFSNITSYLKAEFQILSYTQNTQQQNFEVFETYSTIFTNFFKQIFKIFENIEINNQDKVLQEFQTLIRSFIQYSQQVFSSEYFEISTNDQYQKLVLINDYFRYLIQIQAETDLNEIKNLIGQIKILNQEDLTINTLYLPLLYLPMPKQNMQQEISERFLIFLIDKEEKLKIYTDSIINFYKEIFSKVQQKKRLEIFWKNNPSTSFKISANQEHEQMEFQSFKMLLDSMRYKYQLKKKQIELLILTDNTEQYEKLHLQIKFAQLSNYKFRITFISVGMPFFTYLQTQFKSIIEQQSSSMSNTLIKNIPKQQLLSQSTNSSFDRRSNHSKVLQEIANQIDITNF